MPRIGLILLLVVALLTCGGAVGAAPSLAAAPRRLAVLDFQNRSSGAVTADECLYLSDIVRGAMRRNLSADRCLLMTRENILELLPEGKTLAECIGDCAVQTGRNIGADHVVSGEVTAFAGEIRVTVNLHETMTGNLLGLVRAGAPTLLGVERELETKTLELILQLRGTVPGGSGAPAVDGGTATPAEPWKAPAATKVVVSFTSDPSGALVEMDGQPIGETPCRRAVSPGLYRIGFKKPQHFPYEVAVDVAAGSAPEVDAKLEPDFGWVTVESEPAGLSVAVDGQEVGVTPLVKWEAGIGPHEVTVSSENHYPVITQVAVERGLTAVVRVAPVGRTGGLLITALDGNGNAVDAPIYAGGREVGRSYVPLTLLRGVHKLSIEGAFGYWEGDIEIIEQQVVEREVVLAEAPVSVIGDMRMVRLPPATFAMGSPVDETGHEPDEDLHQVVISHPYLMSATEVTQAQYELLVHANPSRYRGKTAPVESVTWEEALEFCNLLSDSAGLSRAYVRRDGVMTWDRTSPGFRLPTSAEWEYACRAGSDPTQRADRKDERLETVAWFKRNAGRSHHFVGSLAASDWGLYDMQGNVWEWCWDWLGKASVNGDAGAEPLIDPVGPPEGTMRVWRGGSWEDAAKYCRCANVGGVEPKARLSNLGFRVVRTIFN